MKDKSHHLKHLQRKIVQSVRREEAKESKKSSNEVPEEEEILFEGAIEDESMNSADRRATRLPTKSSIH